MSCNEVKKMNRCTAMSLRFLSLVCETVKRLVGCLQHVSLGILIHQVCATIFKEIIPIVLVSLTDNSDLAAFPLPSVSLSAMRGPLGPSSVSGFVTTMEVRGVTKLYRKDMSRALAVLLSFSCWDPMSLWVKKGSGVSWLVAFLWQMTQLSVTVQKPPSNTYKADKYNSGDRTCSPVVVGWWGRPTDALRNSRRCTPFLGRSRPSLPHGPFPAPRSPPLAKDRGGMKW